MGTVYYVLITKDIILEGPAIFKWKPLKDGLCSFVRLFLNGFEEVKLPCCERTCEKIMCQGNMNCPRVPIVGYDWLQENRNLSSVSIRNGILLTTTWARRGPSWSIKEHSLAHTLIIVLWDSEHKTQLSSTWIPDPWNLWADVLNLWQIVTQQ